MTIEAKIILDSISPAGKRLTTFQLRYPRFIHSELMTHRVFSRNASSSRAIPVQRMIEDLRRDPAMPIYWGSNKPGMQAGDELSPEDITEVCGAWLNAMENAIGTAEGLIEFGLHKQIANRILEPWAHINVVVSATDYENFYALRRHKDAQPEIKLLADLMWEAQQASTPSLLQPGDWHLPYVQFEDCNRSAELRGNYDERQELLKKVSVARCARVSYLTFDGKPSTIEDDLALYEKLVGSMPLHASPAEHQATPDPKGIIDTDDSNLWGNFTGWIQYRKTLPGEFVEG